MGVLVEKKINNVYMLKKKRGGDRVGYEAN